MPATSFSSGLVKKDRFSTIEYHYGAILGVLDTQTSVSVYLRNGNRARERAIQYLERHKDKYLESKKANPDFRLMVLSRTASRYREKEIQYRMELSEREDSCECNAT